MKNIAIATLLILLFLSHKGISQNISYEYATASLEAKINPDQDDVYSNPTSYFLIVYENGTTENFDGGNKNKVKNSTNLSSLIIKVIKKMESQGYELISTFSYANSIGTGMVSSKPYLIFRKQK